MKDLTRDLLLRNKARAVLRRKSIDKYLTFEVVDFIDRFGKYCSFYFVHNSCEVFMNGSELIGASALVKSELDKLQSTLICYKDKEDYIKNRLELPKEEDIEKYIEKITESITSDIYTMSTQNFKIVEVAVYFNPAMVLTVRFRFKGELQQPLSLFVNKMNAVEEFYDTEFKEEYHRLVENIGLKTMWY